MYENEVTTVNLFFNKYKRLDLLSTQPDNVINKHIKKSVVKRVYGCHMNKGLKDAGIRYIKEWLLEINDYDEKGNAINVIDGLMSKRLLEELISYDDHNNFDYIFALIMCLVQREEDSINDKGIVEEGVSMKDFYELDLFL